MQSSINHLSQIFRNKMYENLNWIKSLFELRSSCYVNINSVDCMKSECIRFYFQSIKIQIESNLSKMGFIHNLKLDLIFTRGMQCKTKVSWEGQEKFEKYTFALPPVFIKVLRSHFICCQVFVIVDTASREKRNTSWQRYKDSP